MWVWGEGEGVCVWVWVWGEGVCVCVWAVGRVNQRVGDWGLEH